MYTNETDFFKEQIMTVTITEECIACEKCVQVCPEVFAMGDTYAEVKVDTVPDKYEDAVREAAGECPVAAIIVNE
jgi:ferredoxin